MKNKIRKIKKCLCSFGYREIQNGSDILSKPVGYFNMVARVGENCLLLKTIFRHDETNELIGYNSKEMTFDDLNTDNFLELSKSIAYLECEVIGSGSIIYTGHQRSPWNFLKLEEYE